MGKDWQKSVLQISDDLSKSDQITIGIEGHSNRNLLAKGVLVTGLGM